MKMVIKKDGKYICNDCGKIIDLSFFKENAKKILYCEDCSIERFMKINKDKKKLYYIKNKEKILEYNKLTYIKKRKKLIEKLNKEKI